MFLEKQIVYLIKSDISVKIYPVRENIRCYLNPLLCCVLLNENTIEYKRM